MRRRPGKRINNQAVDRAVELHIDFNTIHVCVVENMEDI